MLQSKWICSATVRPIVRAAAHICGVAGEFACGQGSDASAETPMALVSIGLSSSFASESFALIFD